MREKLQLKKSSGWPLLIIASFTSGAALSGAASALGITDFPNDRRGEWAQLTAPLLILLSVTFGIFGVRSLVRPPASRPRQIIGVATALVMATICWLTWWFGYAAT